MKNPPSAALHPGILALSWGLLCALILSLLWWQARAQQQHEQSLLTETVQRQMLEKVAQHKAHLTALSAVAPLQGPDESSALHQVAQSIETIYPRIQNVQLVTTSHPATGSCLSPSVTEAAAALPLKASTSLPDAQHPGHYLFIKKIATPATWLCVRIDSHRFLEPQTLPQDTGVHILLNGHSLLKSPQELEHSQVFGDFTLSGYDQPLQVQLLSSRHRLLNGRMVLLSALISAIVVAGACLLLRSRQQARRHQQQAQLLAYEAQLAHASRVNGMGEMASGIAHELAQPITALLSQSQAALRAHERGKAELLSTALQANVREARRAGAILERMRSYVSNTPSQPRELNLVQSVTQALLLLEGPAHAAQASLHWQPPSQPCWVTADPVLLEQVLHNLVRNALEAMAPPLTPRRPATISLLLEQSSTQAMLKVQDNGPGIDAATAPRIFEPFFTTKSEGMGLGLPLCATLMERMGGRLEYQPHSSGACFIIHLPRTQPL